MAANLRIFSASTLQLYPHNPWLVAPCTCRRPQAATRKVTSRSQAPSQHAIVFESLAGLLCPIDNPISLGVTNLGRGIVASSDIQPGTVLLTLDAFSTLCVVDEPKRTGDAFGAAVLSDWQSVWAIELPATLVRYLSSGEYTPVIAWRTATRYCRTHIFSRLPLHHLSDCTADFVERANNHSCPLHHDVHSAAAPAQAEARAHGSCASWPGCCGSRDMPATTLFGRCTCSCCHMCVPAAATAWHDSTD